MPSKAPASNSTSQGSEWNLCAIRRQFKYRRPICPFICSTFQDFQVERDILVKKVFPSIDALCRARGTFCAPIDLRWGINDGQARSGQIINLCLDYVTRCAPFFICILGERYGSHRPHDSPPIPASYKDMPPDAHWMDRNLAIAASSGYDWVTADRHRDSSVTALEVAQRNALSTDCGDDFSFYYFRQQEHLDYLFTDLPEDEREAKLKLYEPESEHCNEEIRALKASIVRRGIPVRYFKTPEELQRLVLEDWTAVVNKLYPPLYNDIPDIHRESVAEWMAHEAFAESRRRVFVTTPELSRVVTQITDFALTSRDAVVEGATTTTTTEGVQRYGGLRHRRPPSTPPRQSVLLLVGERGSGKSSVISNWYQTFSSTHAEVKVISHYVGCSATSTDVHALMRRFTHEIRNQHKDFRGASPASVSSSSTSDESTDFHNVCEAFHAALRLGPCVLVIDGIDELGETYGCSNSLVKEVSWLPYPLPPQCKIILTSAQSDTSHKALGQRDDTQTITVPLLKDTASKAEVIRKYLEIHCKCLDEKQLQRITSCKLSDRPIFLTVLANELRVFGVYSRLDVQLESYLEAASVRDLWSKIVQRWIRDYGWVLEEKTDKRPGGGMGGKAEKKGEGGGDAEQTDLSGWVADALRLLAVSRSGLSHSEILDLLHQLGYRGNKAVTALDWAMFRSAAMDSLLERPGGLINYFHQHFKEAVEHTLFGGAALPSAPHPLPHTAQHPPDPETLERNHSNKPRRPSRAEYHKHVADYFMGKDHCCRRSEELPWQLERAGEFSALARVLSEPRLFLEMAGDRIMHRKRLELVMYWKRIQETGISVVDTYWAMLRRAIGKRRVDTCQAGMQIQESPDDTTRSLTPSPLPADNRSQHTASRPQTPAYNSPKRPLTPVKDRSPRPMTPSRYRSPRTLTQRSPLTSVPRIIRTKPSVIDNTQTDRVEDSRENSACHGNIDDHFGNNGLDKSHHGVSNGFHGYSVSGNGQLSKSVSGDSGQDDMLSSDHQINGSRRTSIGSVASDVSAISLAANVEPSEAFVDGQARGPKEAARLTMSTGQFLSIMSHFVDAEKMLLTAHEKLSSKCSFSADVQRLLCGLEESIGNMYLYQLRKDAAASWYNLGLRTVDEHLTVMRAGDTEGAMLEMKGRLLDQLGNMKTYSQDFQGADEMLTRAKQCFEKAHCTIGIAIVHYHIGFLKMQQGDFEQAEKLFVQTLTSIERWFGKNHPRVAEVLNDLASLLCHPDNKYSRNLLDAERFHRRALQIRETCFGPDHLLVATSLFHLGKLLKEQNTKAAKSEALLMLRRALDVRTTSLGEKHALTKAVRSALHDLEVSLQMKNKPAPDTRSDDRPYSHLSWHEDKLKDFELKAAKKKAELEARMKRGGEDIEGKERKVQIVVQEVDDESEYSSMTDGSVLSINQVEEEATVDTFVEDVDTDSDTFVEEEEDHSEEDAYIDSFAAEFSTENKTTSKPTTRPQSRYRPKSAPLSMMLEIAARHDSSLNSLRMNRVNIPQRKRLGSAPAQSRHTPSHQRRNSSGSVSVHRKSCSIPGTHTLDVPNAQCTIVGPNMTITSLLDLPEKPRYSAIANGIHHTSAWYHVPGRYSTTERPYPRKRLQKRSSMPRSSLQAVREPAAPKISWASPWVDNTTFSRDMTSKGSVHFGLEPTVTAVGGSNLVVSH